jgi:Family of unknown function (DUF6049)
MLGGVLLATAATSLGALSGHAGETGPAATASLRVVTPAAPQPGETLVLGGAIENTGGEPLGDVQAILRYSAVPLDDRDDIRRVATDQDLRWGQRYTDFFQEVDAELRPGEKVDYQVQVPVDELNLETPGVYAVGVDIRAQPADGERQTFATERTVVPWLPDDELPAVPVALLWPLATQPSLLPDGTLLGDNLAGLLAPGGSLSALVEVPGTTPVTWVVDPDLLVTAGTMADGYAVTAADGTTSEGSGAADAEAWLSRFGAATEGDELLLLPYANPDLPAVARDDERAATDTAKQALTATADWVSRAQLAGGTAIAWPGSGVADEPTLSALAAAGAQTVVLARDAVVGTTDGARAQVRAGDATLDAVLTDGGLESAIAATAAADPVAGVTALRQAWLAETAMAALAADGAAVAPPLLVAAPPPGWQPSADAARALVDVWVKTPWAHPTALADLPAGVDSATQTDPATTAVPTELPPEYVAAVAALKRDSARYAALLAEPDALVEELKTATLRSLATTWRGVPEAGTGYTAEVTAAVALRVGEVSVLVPESVTLSSNKGTFPLTVSNGLPQPVLVSVAVVADYPDRLSVADVSPQRVEAGENATVEVTAEATANGRVPVTVRLTAADGSQLGPSQRMVVNATDYGTIGWVVIGLAVALFVAAAVLRLIRSRRRAVNVEAPVTIPAESEALRETAR